MYPENGHDERVRAFYSITVIQHWLLHAAARHGKSYTTTRASSQLALFAGRLILAHNRRLFPCHKWLMRALECMPDSAHELMTAIDALLEEPQADHATALFESVRDFRN